MTDFFLILGICLLLTSVVVFISLCIFCGDEFTLKGLLLTAVIGSIALGLFCYVGATIDNNSHRAFVASYNAQKFTIEQSLRNSDLSGFERIELVRQASELNGEIAVRKTRIQQWNYFHIDDSIYDGVEYITLEV